MKIVLENFSSCLSYEVEMKKNRNKEEDETQNSEEGLELLKRKIEEEVRREFEEREKEKDRLRELEFLEKEKKIREEFERALPSPITRPISPSHVDVAVQTETEEKKSPHRVKKEGKFGLDGRPETRKSLRNPATDENQLPNFEFKQLVSQYSHRGSKRKSRSFRLKSMKNNYIMPKKKKKKSLSRNFSSPGSEMLRWRRREEMGFKVFGQSRSAPTSPTLQVPTRRNPTPRGRKLFRGMKKMGDHSLFGVGVGMKKEAERKRLKRKEEKEEEGDSEDEGEEDEEEDKGGI